MTVTIANDKRAHQTMIDRCTAQLNALSKERSALLAQLAAIGPQLDAIVSRESARQTHLQTARDNVRTTRDAIARLKTHVSVSEGTVTHSDYVAQHKEQVKTLARLEPELVNLDMRLTREAAIDTDAQHTLAAKRSECEERLRDMRQEQDSYEEMLAAAMQAIGEIEHATILQNLQAVRDLAEQKRQELAEVESSAASVLEIGVSTLAPWPQLAYQLSEQITINDSTTRVLESAEAFLTALIDEGPLVNISLEMFRRLPGMVSSLAEILWMEPHHITPALVGREAVNLLERRQKMQQLLHYYRADYRQ